MFVEIKINTVNWCFKTQVEQQEALFFSKKLGHNSFRKKCFSMFYFSFKTGPKTNHFDMLPSLNSRKRKFRSSGKKGQYLKFLTIDSVTMASSKASAAAIEAIFLLCIAS